MDTRTHSRAVVSHLTCSPSASDTRALRTGGSHSRALGAGHSRALGSRGQSLPTPSTLSTTKRKQPTLLYSNKLPYVSSCRVRKKNCESEQKSEVEMKFILCELHADVFLRSHHSWPRDPSCNQTVAERQLHYETFFFAKTSGSVVSV